MEQFIMPPPETFPLERLPAEIRNMIYYEALVIPKPGFIRLDRGSTFPDSNPACPLLSTSSTIYKEAVKIYYGLNTFSLFDLDLLDRWLRSVRPKSHTLISRISVRVSGQECVKGLKSLAECVGLKELHLDIPVRTLAVNMYNFSYPMVRNLLKLRGLKTVTVETQCLENQPRLKARKELLIKALEILKEPRKLTGQEEKDYVDT